MCAIDKLLGGEVKELIMFISIRCSGGISSSEGPTSGATALLFDFSDDSSISPVDALFGLFSGKFA